MKIDSASRSQYRVQSSIFLLLFFIFAAVLAWFSHSFAITIDLSKNQRNSLSSESKRLLERLDKPLVITLFASPSQPRKLLYEALFQRYQKAQPRISFRSLNLDLHPELLRQHDIRVDGEVLFQFDGRSEKLSQITEANVTTTIQRLLRQGDRWLVFLEGHGERHPYQEANFDYSLFASQLANRGFNIETLKLTSGNAIPDNTDLLILASPTVAMLPGEVKILQNYIDNGGNFLWLADPEQITEDLGLLHDQLAIEFLPGVVVDPNSRILGLDRADFVLVSDYPRHPITNNLNSLSLFPKSLAIETYADELWQQSVFLQSRVQSWNETGSDLEVVFKGDNDDESSGPLNLGVALTRNLENQTTDGQQRVIVVGDADFLSNRYLGNGSNLEIGVNLINWLSEDDQLIAISPRPAPDTRLQLSQTVQFAIAITFLIALPLGFLASGTLIWRRRRNR